MTKKISAQLLPALVISALATACAPKIYVIDNQTVLEEEAAGSWPQFEKEILEKSKAKGPASLSKVPVNARRARLYNVLNGEMGVTPARAENSTDKPAKNAEAKR